MKYNDLNISSNKKPKRVGRGIAAGQGKTAGRGTKGQNSRTGGKRRPGFEGGQNPLTMRLPKLGGFRSLKPKTEVIYTGQLDKVSATVVDNFALFEGGLVNSPYSKVKLILKGEVTKKKNIKLQAISNSAKKAVEKNGGSFTGVEQIKGEEKVTKNKA